MLFLYDLGIRCYYFLVLLASFKSTKARAWIDGRKHILKRIESQVHGECHNAWFHFASLGEFEQGRPVLEELKSQYPQISIVITFFSPSGYEIRKEYKIADNVFYLPIDTKVNAKEFIRLIKPEIAVFTKYEYWFHYFKELNSNNIPLFIVSGIFRPDQAFFKWYGGLHRKMLGMVTHFFVQNADSKLLLESLGNDNVSVTGDTRFDRVLKNMNQVNEVPLVREFCGDSKVFIAGSSWPQDEALIADLPEKFPEWKFIIAPHEIDSSHIQNIEKLFLNSVKYSELNASSHYEKVLIIDNIGMLSSLYQYADIAYIGGGFGVGIHNTQEASAFGLPVIFGPKYGKFQEAKDLIQKGASFSVKNSEELIEHFSFLENEHIRKERGEIAKKYVAEKSGATAIILDHMKENGYLRFH